MNLGRRCAWCPAAPVAEGEVHGIPACARHVAALCGLEGARGAFRARLRVRAEREMHDPDFGFCAAMVRNAQAARLDGGPAGYERGEAPDPLTLVV